MKIEGPGGTPGGFGAFFGGLAMVVVGGYLLTQQVSVYTGFWTFLGAQTFGITLIPVLVGIGFLFFDGRSFAGWFLTLLGAVIILAGIIANLQVHFVTTSLFNTLMMLGLLAGGLGLIARGVRGSSG